MSSARTEGTVAELRSKSSIYEDRDRLLLIPGVSLLLLGDENSTGNDLFVATNEASNVIFGSSSDPNAFPQLISFEAYISHMHYRSPSFLNTYKLPCIRNMNPLTIPPTELTLEVISHLPLSSIPALRRTSREWNELIKGNEEGVFRRFAEEMEERCGECVRYGWKVVCEYSRICRVTGEARRGEGGERMRDAA